MDKAKKLIKNMIVENDILKNELMVLEQEVRDLELVLMLLNSTNKISKDKNVNN